MRNRFYTKLTGVALACALIAGCATQNGAKSALTSTPGAYDKALADADAASKAGDKDKAIGLYQQLAAADPTREEPWSRIAQIQFDKQHYGQAIVAAQEALQRDKTDRAAKSVLAVAGLRVATESVGELRQDASLQGDAKTDAQALAQELRETLGEDNLFPAPAQPARQAAAPVKKRRIVRKAVQKTAPEAAAATPAAPAAGGSGADPFGALRW